jgi:hypothetical protein
LLWGLPVARYCAANVEGERDALRAYVEDWLDTFDSFSIEPVELVDAGEDRIIAVLRASGSGKLSGIETDRMTPLCRAGGASTAPDAPGSRKTTTLRR